MPWGGIGPPGSRVRTIIAMPPDPVISLRIGVSACLAGEPVRYDGTHRDAPALRSLFKDSVEWVAVCPEAEFGLGVPRPVIRLERHEDGVHVVQPETGRDLTTEFDAWCAARAASLALHELDGFVLKARSPSCGLVEVKSYAPGGSDERTDGAGRFAAAVRRTDETLPVIDESQLEDAAVRDTFCDAVMRRARMRAQPGSDGARE